MQRVKNVDAFLAELERPIGKPVGGKVTSDDLDRDAEAFIAFTSAMGIRPAAPKPVGAGPQDADVVPSS